MPETMKPCPYCNRLVSSEGAFCNQCGAALKADSPPPPPQPSGTLKFCPACKQGNRLDAPRCEHCGRPFRTDVAQFGVNEMVGRIVFAVVVAVIAYLIVRSLNL